jgi:hypothetical protein
MSIIAASRLRASVNTNAFIIEVDTSKAGSASDAFQFTDAEGDYDVVAKQNGVVVQTFTNLSDEETITFSGGSGVYVLEVTPKVTNGFTGLQFANVGDRLKMLKIIQWGSFDENRDNIFLGCENLTEIANDNGWLNSLTNGNGMFKDCNLSSLPSSLILGNLTIANEMFRNCNLSSLPSSLTLASLQVAGSMFRDNSLTSLPSGMVLDNLVNGNSMLRSNLLSSLPSLMNLNNLENGGGMFLSNSLTDLPVNIVFGNLTSGNSMFINNTINTTRYSELLVDMEDNNSNNNVDFHGGNSEYNTTGETARDLLTNNQSWSFTDGGLE